MSSPYKKTRQTAPRSPYSGSADVAEGVPSNSEIVDAIDADDAHEEVTNDPVLVGQYHYESLDPLDLRTYAFNTLELYCYQMLMSSSVSRRAFLIDKLKFIITSLVGAQYPWGRLFIRTKMANLVGRINSRHAYARKNDNDSKGIQEHGVKVEKNLIDITPEKWKQTLEQFEDLRDSLLRKDAPAIVLQPGIDSKEEDKDDDFIPNGDDTIDEEMANRDEFSTEYEKMLESIKFHLCLSFIQPQLDDAIQNGRDTGIETVAIPHENMVKFDEAIDLYFREAKDSKYLHILNSLLAVNGTNRSTRYGGLHLNPFNEIKALHHRYFHEFDLERFQLKLLKLLRRWAELVLPLPEFVKLGYGAQKNDGNGLVLAKEDNMDEEDDDDRKPAAKSTDASPRRNGPRDQPKTSPTTAAQSNLATKFTNEGKDQDDDELEDSSEEGSALLANLKRRTKTLGKRVKDPLEECVAKAKTAKARSTGKNAASDGKSDNSSEDDEPVAKLPKRAKKVSRHDNKEGNEGGSPGKKGGLLAQKASRRKIEFDDSDDEGQGGLSEVPEQYKRKEPTKKETQPRATETAGSQTKPKGRKKFTEEEDSAIKNGICKFGIGKWKDIKAYYAIQLKDRTAIQIKDRHRTLEKLGEL